MQKSGFADALAKVVEADPRYHREAYLFLQEALTFASKPDRKQREEKSHHVSGQDLLEGIRKYALKEFGPMTVTVFAYWGIHKGEDFGEMVYNLIREKAFEKTATDSMEDFREGYDFDEAFVKPFQPVEKPVKRTPPSPINRLPEKKSTEQKADDEVRR